MVELLRPLLGYARGGGADARWVVISGDAQFFTLTKRIHNHLHGVDGDGGGLGEDQRTLYEGALERNASELSGLVRPRDVVILHDPQTAGLVRSVLEAGATVIWRCHVGLDVANDIAREAWSFLRSYVTEADAYVLSRAMFAWEGLERERIAVIQPSIDAFATKNADQTAEQSTAILARAASSPAPRPPPPLRPRLGDRQPEALGEALDQIVDGESGLLVADRAICVSSASSPRR